MVMVMAADTLRRNLIAMKERLLDKLKAAAVPADALENARQFLESVVSVAVHGLAKDALLRIKTHLVHPFSSLSPNITRKVLSFLISKQLTSIIYSFMLQAPSCQNYHLFIHVTSF